MPPATHGPAPHGLDAGHGSSPDDPAPDPDDPAPDPDDLVADGSGASPPDLVRTEAERDALLHHLLSVTGTGSGRLALRWGRLLRRHTVLRLVERPFHMVSVVLTLRWPGGLRVNPLFDEAWYRARYPDAPPGRLGAYRQYLALSSVESRDPNPLFDTDWYLERYPDVRRSHRHPLDHYLETGWREHRDPGPHFQTFEYLRHNPECVARGMNPLLHALYGGSPPGRRAAWGGLLAYPGPVLASAARRTRDFYGRYGARRTSRRIVQELAMPLRGFLGQGPEVEPAAEEVNPGRIEAHLDTPQPGTGESYSTLAVAGWATSHGGIAAIEVFVDTRKVADAVTGLTRPDVASRHGYLPGAAESGFSARVPLDDVDPGRHHVQVVVHDGAGNVRLLVCPFVRIEPESMYHHFYLRTLPDAAEVRSLRKALADSRRRPRLHLVVLAGPDEDLRVTLSSIAGQSYAATRCTILADAGDAERTLAIARDAGLDPAGDTLRVVTRPAEALPSSPEPGAHVMVLRAGETLAPEALLVFAAACARKGSPIVYSDHDAVLPTGRHVKPWFVPDWSPEHLLGQDYVGGVFFVGDSKRLREVLPGLLESGGSSWRYELLLAMSEGAERVDHVPRVLWSKPAGTSDGETRAEDERAIVQRALERRGLPALARTVHVGEHGPIRRIEWPLDRTPRVSVIIPTTGRLELVTETMRSLTEGTDYPDLEVVFLDNSRGRNPEGIAFLRQAGVTVLERDEPFNWAKLNDDGARASTGELLLFLNDDMEAVDPGWLSELVRLALRPDVGAVGAYLSYPNGSIQHAGVFVVGHGGGAVHLFHQMDPAGGPYLDLHRVTREVSAVTGACLLVPRAAFEAVGGFDEELSVVGNDVDLCLRLARSGHRVLWTPDARLIHHESMSRSGISYLEDEGRVWSRWSDLLLAGDPYHNPNLAKDRVDCALDWGRVADRQDPILRADPGSGLNLVGYIRAEMGVGEATRGEAQALHEAQVPFVIIDHHQGNPARMGDRTWLHQVVERPVFATNLLHLNADVLPTALAMLPDGLRDGRRNIGYWTWELPEFPRRWHGSFAFVDEVWVPSTFVRDAIGPEAPVPVRVVPHAIRASGGPFLGRGHFALPPDAVQFLAMYDTASVQQRKNPLGAIEAFRLAFGEDDMGVSLVVKVNNPDHRELGVLRDLVAVRPNVHLVSEVLTRSEMDSLLACSDVFVSLHRSEGFGLPIAEAMALGKPVVATGWSGNMDFMSPENAACVSYRLVTLERSFGPYEAGQTWAEPDLDDAAGWMQRLRDDPDLASRLGSAARMTIEARHAPLVVGRLIAGHLSLPTGVRA